VAAQTRSASGNKAAKFAEAWAIITLEGERLYNHRLVRLTQRSTVVRVPLNEFYAPGVRLTATIVQEGQLRSQSITLPVQDQTNRLKVRVQSDRESYRPGEIASYSITTRDFHNKPVPAEVGLSVVDEAIYALRPDTAPEIATFFWGSQETRVETDWSFAARYSGGAYQIMARQEASQTAAVAGPGEVRVRKDFADTAYWNPHILTDEDGAARVSMTMPDDLTTWRATARGLTRNTKAGSDTTTSAVQMPFALRLALPNFTVKGDEVEVSASLHNYTDTAREVSATVEAEGATVANGGARRLTRRQPARVLRARFVFW
jgi:uncharacterized protein YfaS (alpha-2-macroglobulin family)